MDQATSVSESVTIGTDPEKLDKAFIVTEIQKSYWALNRSAETILGAIQNSLNFGIFISGRQIGYARVITDYETFSYLCDVN
jgi:hypothetical protein